VYEPVCYTYRQMHAYELQQARDSQILYLSVPPIILTKIFNGRRATAIREAKYVGVA